MVFMTGVTLFYPLQPFLSLDLALWQWILSCTLYTLGYTTAHMILLLLFSSHRGSTSIEVAKEMRPWMLGFTIMNAIGMHYIFRMLNSILQYMY